MTPRFAASRSLRLFAALPTALALVASLALPAQFVAADSSSVTVTKTSSVGATVQSPGDSYTYTIRATTNAPVDGLIVRDANFDYPQISVTSVSYTLNGVGPKKCGGPRPDNIRCLVGSVPAGTTVVVTVNVMVNPNVDVACDKPGPGGHGTKDSTVYNIASAIWTQSSTSYSTEAPRVTVRLNCAGYNPNATPAPDTTITGGPVSGTTSPTATFTFTATNSPTSFRCALDGGSFSTCTSPKTYSGLSISSHLFEVQGVNATGPDGTPATRAWTIKNPFTDIGSSIFKNDILYIYSAGITGGCASDRYCPNSNVLRDQMASFLVRALHLPSTTRDFYTDDEGNIHEGDINRLAAAGITGGCAVNRYCPTASVKRDQMASFLVRAFRLPASSTNYFTDDNGNLHENQINALRQSGITGGCSTTKYCPSLLVSRGQMAAFLHRALLR